MRPFPLSLAKLHWAFRFVVAVIFGLFLAIAVVPTAVGPPMHPIAGLIDDPDGIPIVAILGQPLAEHEEPLPPGARVRFGSTRFRHPLDIEEHWPVLDGRYLLSVGHWQLTVTDTSTGLRVVTQPLSSDLMSVWWNYSRLTNVVVSPDGRSFAIWGKLSSAPNSVVARVWEIDPDVEQVIIPIASIRLPENPTPLVIERATFSTDGRELVLYGSKGLLTYEARTGHLTRIIESETEVLAVAAGGRRFVTASVDYPTIICFSGKVVIPTYRFRPRSAESHTLPVFDGFDLTPRPPNRPVDLIVRDAVTGDYVATIPMPESGRHYAERAAISPDGNYVSVTCLGDVFVWDVNSGKQVLRIDPVHKDPGDPPDRLVSSFTPDSRWLIVFGDRDRKRQRRFDLRTGREVTHEQMALHGHWPWINRKRQIVDVDDAGVIRRRDSVSGQPLALPTGYGRLVMDCSQSGRLIAIGDATGRIDVWRPDGRRVRTLQTSGDAVVAVAFNPDGTRLAACDRARVIRIWSIGDGREYHRVNVPAERNDLYPDRLTFTPDGQRLLLSRGEIMALWQPGSTEWLWDQSGHWSDAWYHLAPVITPDGQSVVITCRGCSRSTWLDAGAGAPKREMEHPGSTTDQSCVWALAVSPDGRTVATMHSGRELRLQDVGTGAVSRPFELPPGGDDSLGVLCFSRDGRRIVACGVGRHAHVWEVASGQLAFTLTYPDGDIADVFFGHDGRSLITSNHREVIVWDLPPDPGASADLWADLGHEAPRAEHARRALLANPGAAVELFRAKLRPVAPLNEADVERLIRWLDANDFRVRERAVAGLLAAGCRALAQLKEAKLTSEEGSARLAAVVRDLSAGLTKCELRHVRSIEVLEQIDTPAARELIDKLAAGDPAAVLTEEARKSALALDRAGGPSPTRHDANPQVVPRRNSLTTLQPVMSTTPALRTSYPKAD